MTVGVSVDESRRCNNAGIVYFFSTFSIDLLLSLMKILKTIRDYREYGIPFKEFVKG
jgi:hypothetical protein